MEYLGGGSCLDLVSKTHFPPVRVLSLISRPAAVETREFY
jgi:hypothetical protein